MRFAFLASLTVLLCGELSHASAHGFGPACPMPIAFEMRPVVCYRPEWREEKVPCVVQRVSYRKEVKPVPTQVWTLKEFDERVRTSYYVPVPREVERDVHRCVMVPVMMFDPCTCCCYATYQPQWVVERVRTIECDYRREERDVNVRVCRWVQEPRVIEQVNWIPVITQEQTWTVRRYCVMVPYQTMVCVPVCCP